MYSAVWSTFQPCPILHPSGSARESTRVNSHGSNSALRACLGTGLAQRAFHDREGSKVLIPVFLCRLESRRQSRDHSRVSLESAPAGLPRENSPRDYYGILPQRRSQTPTQEDLLTSSCQYYLGTILTSGVSRNHSRPSAVILRLCFSSLAFGTTSDIQWRPFLSLLSLTEHHSEPMFPGLGLYQVCGTLQGSPRLHRQGACLVGPLSPALE